MADPEKAVNTRYEWTAGPLLISRFERTEFHAGKGVLKPKGRQIRMIVGQVRDKDLGIVLNWAVAAPRDQVNARIDLAERSDAIPHAADWAPKLKSGVGGFPKGWTLPAPGADFIQGLIA